VAYANPPSVMRKAVSKFTTVDAARNLISAMEAAIQNMTEEIRKPVDPDLTGSARKAELQAIKDTALACKELIVERQRLEQLVGDLEESGGIEEEKDFKGGFAERNARR
jgi:hypothetical protein